MELSPLSRTNLVEHSQVSDRVTELECLMQEQINMINSQKNTIKEQENMIDSQKSLIGRLSRERQVDSDYETYATSPYSRRGNCVGT